MEFDKYDYYLRSVQNPETEVDFFLSAFSELSKRPPQVLGEDFCGAFALSCEWVRRDPSHRAVAVDVDGEPLCYGSEKYLSQLTANEKERLLAIQKDVLSEDLPPADLVAAVNFSYYTFKTRKLLTHYFRSVHRRLTPGGLLILDALGGSETQSPNEEETEHEDFSYFWDQERFDPITNEALFHIHFKRPGEAKRERVFSYDWRMWTIPELREILSDSGFKESFVYWEGTTTDGEGDGDFRLAENGEGCASWVAYVVGKKCE